MEKKKVEKKEGNKFLAIIRIVGQVGLERNLVETLDRLRIRKKYACVVLVNPNENSLGMVSKVYDLVSFGEIDEKTFVELLKARGKLIDKSKKVNFDEIPKKLIEGKNYSELNVKPFFRLHPPRGGIDTKKHFGVKKGVLGNAGENIDKLLRRML
jgi:large subunit ribosomal protein L30